MSAPQRAASHRSSSKARSAITNGKHLLAGVDGRSSRGRRLRDVMHQLTADLGGPEAITVTQTMLIKQAAALTLVVEDMQARIVNSETVDPTDLTRLTGALTRVLSKLGIKDKPAPKPPGLAEYLAKAAAGEAAA